MSFSYDNFLGNVAGAGDVSQQIAEVEEKAFFVDGSKSMLGPISMASNLIIGPAAVEFKEVSSGATPPADHVSLYAKLDGEFYQKDDGGLETKLAGGGDVDGPISSTLDAIPVFADTSGKLLKNSSITVDPSGADLIIPQGGGVIFTESKGPATESVELTAGSMGSSYTIVLPTAPPDVGGGDCFINASGDNAAWSARVEHVNDVPLFLDLIPTYHDTTGNEIHAQQFIGIVQSTGNFTRLTLPWITQTATSTGWGSDSMTNITTSVLNYSAGDESCEELKTGLGKNCCIGIRAGQGAVNAEYSNVVAIGHEACQSLSSSQNIVGIGKEALVNLTGVGSNNIVSIGSLSGVNLTTGSSNVVLVSNPGVVADANLMKIGTNGVHLTTSIAGITGVTPAGSGFQTAIVDSDGQMGSQTSLQNSTGVTSGGIITINAGDAKTFDVSDGEGFIYNPVSEETTIVSWSGLTAQSTAYVGIFTFISINSGGTVSFSTTAPTNAETRDEIFLGDIVHPDAITIVAIGDQQVFLCNPINQLRDLATALGNLNVSGNSLSSNLLLTFAKSVGTMYKFGSNYDNDKKDPSTLVLDSQDTNVASTFQYIYQDGSQSAAITSVLPAEWDDGNGQSTPGTLSANNWQVQRVYSFVSQAMLIQPGQFTYGTLDAALGAIESEAFVTTPSLLTNGIIVGFIAMRGGATDLSNSGHASFVQASALGGVSGGSAGNVTGVASSTNNHVVLWSGSDGTMIKDTSAVTIDSSSNVTGIVGLTATGDIDFNTIPSLNILTTDNTATALQVRSQGGTSAEIHIINETGTTDDSIKIDSVAGGIDVDCVSDFHVDVATGRVDLHALASTSGTAIQLNAPAGGVNIDAGLNILLDSATGRIDLAAIASTAINAVMLDAQAGGVDISAALDVDIDAASDIFMDAATGRIDLRAVASTSATAIQLQGSVGGVNISSGLNSAQCIHLHANAGISETIRIHSDQGTGGASIDIESDVGGIQIIAEAATLADAVKIQSQAGGLDLDAKLNITIDAEDDMLLTAADGRIDLRAVASTSATAIQLDAAAGGLGMTAELNTANAIQLKSLNNAGGVEVSCGVAGLLSLNQAAGTRELEFFGAGGVVQATTGVAENTFTENAGGAVVNVDSTFGGYTLQQVVNAMQLYGLLA